MKRHLLLGILAALGMMTATDSLGQDVTYYWPKERATTLQSGTKYFMYNTAYDKGAQPNDRGSFLYVNNTGNFETLNPK